MLNKDVGTNQLHYLKEGNPFNSLLLLCLKNKLTKSAPDLSKKSKPILYVEKNDSK